MSITDQLIRYDVSATTRQDEYIPATARPEEIRSFRRIITPFSAPILIEHQGSCTYAPVKNYSEYQLFSLLTRLPDVMRQIYDTDIVIMTPSILVNRRAIVTVEFYADGKLIEPSQEEYEVIQALVSRICSISRGTGSSLGKAQILSWSNDIKIVDYFGRVTIIPSTWIQSIIRVLELPADIDATLTTEKRDIILNGRTIHIRELLIDLTSTASKEQDPANIPITTPYEDIEVTRYNYIDLYDRASRLITEQLTNLYRSGTIQCSLDFATKWSLDRIDRLRDVEIVGDNSLINDQLADAEIEYNSGVTLDNVTSLQPWTDIGIIEATNIDILEAEPAISPLASSLNIYSCRWIEGLLAYPSMTSFMLSRPSNNLLLRCSSDNLSRHLYSVYLTSLKLQYIFTDNTVNITGVSWLTYKSLVALCSNLRNVNYSNRDNKKIIYIVEYLNKEQLNRWVKDNVTTYIMDNKQYLSVLRES